jgi:hypothetical protein
MSVSSRGFPLKPVFAEQLAWMGCANGSIPTAERVSRAIFVTSPTDSFGLVRMERNLCHGEVVLPLHKK